MSKRNLENKKGAKEPGNLRLNNINIIINKLENNNTELSLIEDGSFSDDNNDSIKNINSMANTSILSNNDAQRKPKFRQENSLGELTKNFIKYIKESSDRIVHINDAVRNLKVKKRRIYDITNVLEGKYINYLIH